MFSNSNPTYHQTRVEQNNFTTPPSLHEREDYRSIKGGQPAKVMINDTSSTTTDDTHSHQSLDQQMQYNDCFFEDNIYSQNTIQLQPSFSCSSPTIDFISQEFNLPFQKPETSLFVKSRVVDCIYDQIDKKQQDPSNEYIKNAGMIYNETKSNNSNQTQVKKIEQKSQQRYEDRFIPSRKYSKLSIALTPAHDENIIPSQISNGQTHANTTNSNGTMNSNQCQIIQAVNQADLCSQQVTIADLYKTQVLGIKPPQTKFSQYEGNYNNRNILAFSTPNEVGQSSSFSKKLKSKSGIINENNIYNEPVNFDKLHNYQYGISTQENWSFHQAPLIDSIAGGSSCSQNYYSRQIFSHLDPLRTGQNNYPFSLNPDIKSYFTRNSRKISKIPFKVLDAPTLKDDFYLNLIDWGENNQIAVGLGSCVYLWSAVTSRVTKLCDLRAMGGSSNLSLDDSDNVTSVSWANQGSLLSIGTNSGIVQIWDVASLKKVKEYHQHRQRVGALAWNKNILTSGSRDKKIIFRDIRSYHPVIYKLSGHKQEICGLKWSYDNQMLASGGNDNNLFVWNMHSTSPIIKLQSHTAAVKALSWSPHQHGLLISGGGSLDRTIRIWNTITREQIKCIDTGSQVCNLQYCKNRNEFVSTHGYSENQITIWNYPDLDKLAVLTGHTQRVLHLAMSPDGDTIATGAGDETLRFWNINDNSSKQSDSLKDSNSSQLLPSKNYLR